MPNDYKLDTDTLDLSIANGDFITAESTEQHQRLLLTAMPGEYKQKPLLGVGLANYLLEERPGNLLSTIRYEFVKDGMRVDAISFSNEGTLIVKADYV